MLDFTLTNKDAKNFITKLNNINQIMKTMRHDSSYTIYKGSCLASPNGVNKLNAKGGYDKVDIGRTYTELNIDLGELNDFALYVHDGKALYRFISDFKKFIEKVSVSFESSTSTYYLGLYTADNVFLITMSKSNRDVLVQEELLGIFKRETQYPNATSHCELSHQDILMLSKEKTIPLVLELDGYKIRTTRKMLTGMTTTDEIELAVYQTLDPCYFISIFTIFRKEMTIYHAYKCVKY